MFRQMRLHDKMTLWYTLLTLLTLIAFSCAVYFMTQYVLEEIQQRNTRLSLQQVISQIEEKRGSLIYENEVPVSTSTMYFVTEMNGSELASYGADITLFDTVPIKPDVFQHASGASEEWLLLDSDVVTVNHFSLQVRVATSCELNNRILYTMRLVFLLGIPLILSAATIGGRLIAKRSLKPIREIIHSANRISEGDLSARIPQAPAKDELGELIGTLNGMLQSLETTFIREKRFTSDASHELRTPIAVIRAYTESLSNSEGITDEQKASLGTMLMECTRVQKIIEQLLTITRGQESRYPLCIEEINLREICICVADTLADRLNARHIDLHIDIPSDLTFHGDQTLLTEMLLNLVENAVKYGTEFGYINIRAKKSANKVHIEVGDNGIGITEDALPHIFERFYRVDAARDRSGTGLGLSIVDWIVKAHHGVIDVASTLGQGTVVTISLPLDLN